MAKKEKDIVFKQINVELDGESYAAYSRVASTYGLTVGLVASVVIALECEKYRREKRSRK